ncbi:MoaB/Mog domain-containing protein [Halteromyces radiatus]|uniref:MoaB/Mog domain-containing protein n=1 Tax=Halteromyces radiatus TaxID=101107 RepID=UPI00221E6501|nr:MoaB/Mog domain-containing protein [Halteromyces radiatus]KAI8093409.1 MoaB/Mog domain-containing protein [Halteromyces radiatus]
MNPYKVGIITVSDTSAADRTKDKSGPLLQQLLTEASSDYQVLHTTVVPDEAIDITRVVQEWADTERLDLILLTGGTGFAERDITPDSIEPLLTRLTPGITHLLISTSLTKTPFAALSRPISGFRNKTLCITLPGSPKACRENMDSLFPILPHALDLVRGQHGAIRHTHSHIASTGSTTNQQQQQQHTCVHHHQQQQQQVQKHSAHTLDLNTPVSQRARVSPYPMISVEEAQSIISRYAQPLETVDMKVSEDLIGYVLAEDVYAKEPVPGYRASIVDGYAVHAEDGPGIYPVCHVSLATSHYQEPKENDDSMTVHTPFQLKRGQISRVATGGMVPDGANAVVMVEDTRLVERALDNQEEAMVEIMISTQANSMIRSVGSDCQQGDLVCSKGTVISTVGGELGLLASVGVTSVLVYRKPRVGVLSSGNEVQDITMTSRPLVPGEIRDSNRLTLLAAIRQANMEPVDLGIVPDNVDAMEQCLQQALLDLDVIISTGGVSMGEADYMKPLLEQRFNATLHFGRVHMKPGKPTTFATIPTTSSTKQRIVFALPGNPVSAVVTFYLFVLPALRQMCAIHQPKNVILPVKILHDIYLDSRPEYHRVRVYMNAEKGHLEALSTGQNQQSSRMISMVAANGLLQLPIKTDDLSMLKKDDIVECIILGPLYQK